jgi:hypothetical protein
LFLADVLQGFFVEDQFILVHAARVRAGPGDSDAVLSDRVGRVGDQPGNCAARW